MSENATIKFIQKQKKKFDIDLTDKLLRVITMRYRWLSQIDLMAI